VRTTLAATLAALSALPACGALLDLDVTYADGGAGSPDGGGGDESGSTDGAVSSDGLTSSEGSNDGPAALDADAGEATTADGGPGLDAPVTPETSVASPTIVQLNAAQADPGVSVATIQFPGPVTAHDTLVVAFDYDAYPDVTVTDSLNNVFQPAIGPVGTGVNCWIWYALDVAGGVDTITLTAAYAPPTFFEYYIHEYAGISALDGTAGRNDATASGLMESGFVTTMAANELVFGFGVTGTAYLGSGFTVRSQFNHNITEDRIFAAPGAIEATAYTQDNGWTMLVATFKPR
jgi:hypothetical protein